MSKELFPHFFLPHFFKQNYSRNTHLSIVCEGIKLSSIGRDSFKSLCFDSTFDYFILWLDLIWFTLVPLVKLRRPMFCFRLRAMLHWLETFVLFSIKLFIQWNFGYHCELIATGRLLVFDNWTSMLRLHDSPSKPDLTVHTPAIDFSIWRPH